MQCCSVCLNSKQSSFGLWLEFKKTHGILIKDCLKTMKHQRLFIFKFFLLSVSLSLDGKQDDHITEYDSETQIQYFGTSESWCSSRKQSRIAECLRKGTVTFCLHPELSFLQTDRAYPTWRGVNLCWDGTPLGLQLA